jgi:hypothetical protein
MRGRLDRLVENAATGLPHRHPYGMIKRMLTGTNIELFSKWIRMFP